MSESNVTNRLDTEMEMMKEMIEVMKSFKDSTSSKSMTLDEVLWLILFIFVLFNKIYNYYFKRRCEGGSNNNVNNNESSSVNRDPSQCELI